MTDAIVVTETSQIRSIEDLRKELYDLTQIMLAYGLPSIELRAMFTRQLELEARTEALENALLSMPGSEVLELDATQRALQTRIDAIRRDLKGR